MNKGRGDQKYEPLFAEIDRQLAEKGSLAVAIDGPCGSGKTTLAGLLAQVYDCNVVQLDDFFLPPALRTPERLAEPGGNVHYERVMEEVLVHLSSETGFTHRFFDCAIMAYTEVKRFSPKALTIIEGSYSHRPEFVPFYDLKVFLTIEPTLQRERILARNGPEKYRRFLELWIPLENRYFEAFQIQENSDLVI